MSFLLRSPVLILLVGLFVAVPSIPSATAAAAPFPALRVRIHDYAKLRSAQLARTQRIVTRLYGAIDVHTEWLESMRPLDVRMVPPVFAPNDLTIIVLTSEMAERRMVPPAIAGYAAVTPGKRGRIAFVIYDRIRDIANRAETDIGYVMGTVIAHEIGHLLLPAGGHSNDGLMRRDWDATDFRRADLHFSWSQGEEIRQTIGAGLSSFLEDARRTAFGPDTPVGRLATIVD